jgi:hypothetical protein
MPAVQAQQDRISGPIDASRSVVLDSKVAPLKLAQRGDEGPVEPSRQLPWITLTFKRTAAQEDALTRLLAEQQDSSSPNYHKWLSSEQFADSFGLSRNDIDKIAAWLRGQGFNIAYVARDRDFIAVSGTAEQVRNAFHTEIHRYTIGGEAHIMNATAPSVPAALGNMVLEIRGLNDLRPKSGLVRGKHTSQGADRPNETLSGGHSLVPDDIATIYDITPLYNHGINGSGQNIVVVGQSNINLSDMAGFRASYGLPGGDPQVVLCCTPDPGFTDAQGEADLDLEWISAVARNASITFVYSYSADSAVGYAIDNSDTYKESVISESFGLCEQVASSGGANPSGYESAARTANAKGITWVASTGDSGAAACDSDNGDVASQGLAVQLPSSIPEVTAVGGTEFNEGSGTYWSGTNSATDASALSYIPEIGWNDTPIGTHLASGGGGVSTFYSKPAWQTGPGVPNDGMRDLPDVAMDASADHDGYWFYTPDPSTGVSSLVCCIGGTSAAAPVMAGIVALLNQSLAASGKPSAGNINPNLYSLAYTSSNIFHDITSGNNMVPCTAGSPNCVGGTEGYSAGVGFDLVTGLGSVDVYNLVQGWGGGSLRTSQTVVSANPLSIMTNGSTQVTATVSRTSGSGTPTGSVSFAVGSNSLGTAVLSGSTASLTVYGSALSTGSNLIVGTYSGDANFSGSSGSVSVTVSLPTANSAVIPSVTPNPVYQQAADSQGYSWFYTVQLTEVAGVSTTLTDFTINGTDYASYIASFFGSASIPANGSLSASLRTKGLTVPTTVVFVFTGMDGNGHQWTQQLSVPFYGTQIAASILMTSIPPRVREDTIPIPDCPTSGPPEWLENLGLQEQNGHSVALSTFKATDVNGTIDLSSQITDYFGSTTLPAYGSLLTGICWSGFPSVPVTETYEVDGTDDLGNPITSTTSAIFDLPPPSGATLSVGPSSISMNVTSASNTASSSLPVNVPTGSPWMITVFPANRTTSWLGVQPSSGIGPATATITGNDPALTASAPDSATLAVQAVNAFPQFIEVPVSLTLSGGNGNCSPTSGLIMPQVVDGTGWQTTFGVTNTDATTATATLQFYQVTDAAGDTGPWTLPLVQAVSTTNMQLAPGATVYLQTPDTATTLSQGFGQLIAGPGVQGYSIFTLHVPGRQDQDGTAPAAAPGSVILVPFDNSPGFTTTIAVVNATCSAETISANLRLASGQIIPGSLPSIPPLGHAAFSLVAQFPQSSGQQGTLELSSSSGTFSVVALRFNPTGAFTSLPVYVVSGAPFPAASHGPAAGAPATPSGKSVSPSVGRR